MMNLPSLFNRYVVLAVGFTLTALALLYVTANNVSVSSLLPNHAPPSPSPLLKCPPAAEICPEHEEPPAPPDPHPSAPWEFSTSRDADDYGLSHDQCRTAFPKLFGEIEKVVNAREGERISWKELDSRTLKAAEVRAMVYQGQLYVIDFKDMKHTFTRAKATLNSLNRALDAVPDRRSLPNVEFIFSSEDYAEGPQPVWVYSKRDEDTFAWLMPDFGYWSWPETNVGAYRDVRRRIAALDEDTVSASGETELAFPFREKKKELIWRGNLGTAPKLRGALLEASKGKPWSSVKELDWGNKKNFIPIEEHCQYMFMAHVEGRSYSGRGKYLQNCRSVVIAHELHWREVHHAALVHEGPDANYVRVSRDFSDLEENMDYLLENPDVAERIANNSVRVFRDRYLTPAAEACYWRELIQAYGDMCDFEPVMYVEDNGKMVPRGVAFESFILDGKLPTGN